jgi:uncharacterized protein YjbI with pentapeptide repeats
MVRLPQLPLNAGASASRPPARAADLDIAVAHANDLAHARDDFTTADLRGIDLTRISLDGVRWSEAAARSPGPPPRRCGSV